MNGRDAARKRPSSVTLLFSGAGVWASSSNDVQSLLEDEAREELDTNNLKDMSNYLKAKHNERPRNAPFFPSNGIASSFLQI
jgi:hypothetical protein